MRTIAALFLALGVAACTAPGYLPFDRYAILNDDILQGIHPGQSRDDVERLIGPPVRTMHFPRLGHTAWDYRYVDTWGYPAIFSVTFDSQGRVVSKISQRIERERR